MKHTPKPLVEEHYHIQELIDAQEKRASDRQSYRDQKKLEEDRMSLINDAKMVVATDFWCSKCCKEFKQSSVLNVEQDWSNTKQFIAFYRGKCRKCGERAIRYLTDKHKDPFWYRSRSVRLEQGKYHNDLLQPFETGYNLLYGK